MRCLDSLVPCIRFKKLLCVRNPPFCNIGTICDYKIDSPACRACNKVLGCAVCRAHECGDCEVRRVCHKIGH